MSYHHAAYSRQTHAADRPAAGARGAIFVATTLDYRVNPLDPQDKLTVSLYCTTALPLIVAVTSLAVQGGTMHQTTASTLVAAGAVTVFLMPLLGGLTSKLMKGETRLIAPTA
ncbi:hypothetical protein [Bifidobacterium breve]|uniref:hypothetical protein n=1 Tax=Bifidobacterium breve TaxID=1685 RepID=UPI00374F0F52